MLSIRSRWSQANARASLTHTWSRAAGVAADAAAVSTTSLAKVACAAVAPVRSAPLMHAAPLSTLVHTPGLRSQSNARRQSASVRAKFTRLSQPLPHSSLLLTPARSMATDAASGDAVPPAAAAKPAATSAPTSGSKAFIEPEASSMRGSVVARSDKVSAELAAAKAAAADRARRGVRLVTEEKAQTEKSAATPSGLVVSWKFPSYFDPRFEPPPLNSFRKDAKFKFLLFDPTLVGAGQSTAENIRMQMDEGALILWHQRYQHWVSARAKRNEHVVRQRAEYVAAGYPTRLTASEAEFQAFIRTDAFFAFEERVKAEDHTVARFNPTLEPSTMFPYAPESTDGKYHPSFEPIAPELWNEYNITARDSEEYAAWFHAWLAANPAVARQREIYQRLVAKYVGPVWRARMSAETDRIIHNERTRAGIVAARAREAKDEAINPKEVSIYDDPELEVWEETDKLLARIDPLNPHDPRIHSSSADAEALIGDTVLDADNIRAEQSTGLSISALQAEMQVDLDELVESEEARVAQRLEEREEAADLKGEELAQYRAMREAQLRPEDIKENYIQLDAATERALYPDRFAVVKRQDVELERALSKMGDLSDIAVTKAWIRVQRALDRALVDGRADAKKAIKAQIASGELKPTDADRAAAAAEQHKELTHLRSLPMAIYRRALHNKVARDEVLQMLDASDPEPLNDDDLAESPLDLDDEPTSIEGLMAYDVTDEPDPLNPVVKVDIGAMDQSLSFLEQKHIDVRIRERDRNAAEIVRLDARGKIRDPEKELEMERDALDAFYDTPHPVAIALGLDSADPTEAADIEAKLSAMGKVDITPEMLAKLGGAAAAIGEMPAAPTDAAAADAAAADATAAPEAAPAAAAGTDAAGPVGIDAVARAQELALSMTRIAPSGDVDAAPYIKAMLESEAARVKANHDALGLNIPAELAAKAGPVDTLLYEQLRVVDEVTPDAEVIELAYPGSRLEAEMEAQKDVRWGEEQWAAARIREENFHAKMVPTLPAAKQEEYRTFALAQAVWAAKTEAERDAHARQVIKAARPEVTDEAELNRLVTDYKTEQSTPWNPFRPPLGTESWSRSQLLAFLPGYLKEMSPRLANMHRLPFEGQLKWLKAQMKLSDEFRAQEQLYKRELKEQRSAFVQRALGRAGITELTARAQLMGEAHLLTALTPEQKANKAVYDAARLRWREMTPAEQDAAAEKAIANGDAAAALEAERAAAAEPEAYWPNDANTPEFQQAQRVSVVTNLVLAREKKTDDKPAAAEPAADKAQLMEAYKRSRDAAYTAKLAAEKRKADGLLQATAVAALEAQLADSSLPDVTGVLLQSLTREQLVDAPGSEVWARVPLATLGADVQELAAREPYEFAVQLRDHLYQADEEIEYESRAAERAALTRDIHAQRQAHLEAFVADQPEAFRFHSAEEAHRARIADAIEFEERIKSEAVQWRQSNPEWRALLENRESLFKRGVLQDDRVPTDPLEPTRQEIAIQQQTTRQLESQLEQLAADAPERAEVEKHLAASKDGEAFLQVRLARLVRLENIDARAGVFGADHVKVDESVELLTAAEKQAAAALTQAQLAAGGGKAIAAPAAAPLSAERADLSKRLNSLAAQADATVNHELDNPADLDDELRLQRNAAVLEELADDLITESQDEMALMKDVQESLNIVMDETDLTNNEVPLRMLELKTDSDSNYEEELEMAQEIGALDMEVDKYEAAPLERTSEEENRSPMEDEEADENEGKIPFWVIEKRAEAQEKKREEMYHARDAAARFAALLSGKTGHISSWEAAKDKYSAVESLESWARLEHQQRYATWESTKAAAQRAELERLDAEITAFEVEDVTTVEEESDPVVYIRNKDAYGELAEDIREAEEPHTEMTLFSFHVHMQSVGPSASILAEELAAQHLAKKEYLNREELVELVREAYPAWCVNSRQGLADQWMSEWQAEEARVRAALPAEKAELLEDLPAPGKWSELSPMWQRVHARTSATDWLARVLLFEARKTPAQLEAEAAEQKYADDVQEMKRFWNLDDYDIEWQRVLAARQERAPLDDDTRRRIMDEHFVDPDLQPYLADELIPNPHIIHPEVIVDADGHKHVLIEDESQLYQPFRTDVSLPFSERTAGSLSVQHALHHFEIRRRPQDEIEHDISEMRIMLDNQSLEDHLAPHGRVAAILRELKAWKLRKLEPTKAEVAQRAKQLYESDKEMFLAPLPEKAAEPAKPIAVDSKEQIDFTPGVPLNMERESTSTLLDLSAQQQVNMSEQNAQLAESERGESITTDEHPLVLVGDTEVDEDTLHEMIMRQVEEYEILGFDKFGRLLTPAQIDHTPFPLLQKALARVGYLPNPYSDAHSWRNRVQGSGTSDLFNRDAMIALYKEEFALETREAAIRARENQFDMHGKPIKIPRTWEENEFMEFREQAREDEPDFLEVMSEEEIATWKSYNTDEGMIRWIAEGGLFKTQAEWVAEMRRGRAMSLDQLEGSIEDLPLLQHSGLEITFEENDEHILKHETERIKGMFEDLKLLQHNPQYYVHYFAEDGSGEFSEEGKRHIHSVLSKIDNANKRVAYLKALLEWKRAVGGETEDGWTLKLWLEEQKKLAKEDEVRRIKAAGGIRKKRGDDDDDDMPSGAGEEDVGALSGLDAEMADEAEYQARRSAGAEDPNAPLKAADGSDMEDHIFEVQDVETGEMVKYRHTETGDEVPLTKHELERLPKAKILSLEEEFEAAKTAKATTAERVAGDEDADEDEAEDDEEGGASSSSQPQNNESKRATAEDSEHPLLATWAKPSTLRHVKELPHMDPARYNEFQAMLYLKQKVYKMLALHFPGSGNITLKMNQPQLFYPERKFRQHYANADPNLARAISGGHSNLQLFQVIFLMRKYRNATILAEHVAREIGVAKSHSGVLRSIESVVKWMESIPGLDTGLMIKVSGRINGAAMASHYVIKSGNIPLQTFHANIDYALAHAHARIGVFGVKVWLFQRKLDRKEMQSQALNKKSSGRPMTKYL